MSLSVGDEVLIKSDLGLGNYDNILTTHEMLKYCAELATIMYVEKHAKCIGYRINLDHGKFLWTESMFMAKKQKRQDVCYTSVEAREMREQFRKIQEAMGASRPPFDVSGIYIDKASTDADSLNFIEMFKLHKCEPITVDVGDSFKRLNLILNEESPTLKAIKNISKNLGEIPVNFIESRSSIRFRLLGLNSSLVQEDKQDIRRD